MSTMKKTTKKADEAVMEEAVETVAAEPKKTVKTARKYEATEGVPCKSITSGGLYMTGIKSHILYEWADNGDITEVEYQDLLAAIRSNSGYIIKPLFVIEDEELVSQYPKLKKIYDTMYSFRDLKEVLELPVGSMKTTILSLPEGAKESIKHIASQMVTNGTLDSVRKIKVLDDIFNTQLVLLTGLFNE